MPMYKKSECSSNCGDNTCFPCLPRCHRSEITYCCEKKPSECHMRCCEEVCCDVPKVRCRHRSPPRVASPVCHHYHEPRRSPPRSPVFFSRPRSPQLECCSPAPRRYYSPPPPPECCTPIPNCRQYKVCCQPVRTKYVIPCYRYEDGRIENQPTVLMRRACEVAVGVRPRRKPFVEASYSASDDQEVRRYHSEDQMGNCCYHFEKTNKGVCEDRSFTTCIPSDVANPASCCVYY